MLHAFDGNIGAKTGANPYVNLVEVNNILYGLTKLGGIYNDGVLFQYDLTTNTFTKNVDLINFGEPYGGLTVAHNEKLYFMTTLTGNGAILEYDIASKTATLVFRFLDENLHGKNPRGNLLQASNSNLYGFTILGGQNDKGVLFEFDPVSYVFNKKVDYDSENNGAFIYGSLIEFNSSSLNLKKLAKDQILLYPNPSSETIYIKSLIQIDAVEIYSILGNKILRTTTSKINISSLQSGLYLLKIYAKNNQITKKLIIE